jgi:Fe-S oxidoreductase
MRRHLVMTESRFPREIVAAFKGIESQGNPWGLAQEKRADWAEGFAIPIMAEVEDPAQIDALYWVGCLGSYDRRNQKVSRAFATLMKRAGVKFAILGKEETCTGDPARRPATSICMELLRGTISRPSVGTSHGEL